MGSDLFMGIDIGTQGTKAVVCDVCGNIIGTAFVPSKLIFEGQDTVYENAENMFSSVIHVIKEITEQVGENSGNIRAIGIDSQMSGIMGIREDFSTATPYDSWLDSRCSNYTRLLENELGEEAIEYSGGQFVHAHSSKILWWKAERPEAYKTIKSSFNQTDMLQDVYAGWIHRMHLWIILSSISTCFRTIGNVASEKKC